MRTLYAWPMAALLLLSGCSSYNKEQAMTQLQIRQLQTRTLHTDDTKVAMKSILNTFQDEGFVLKNVDSNLGVLVATKEASVEKASSKFWSIFLWGSDARWDKNTVIEASATLTPVGDEHHLRVNFQRKTLNNVGVPASIENVLNEHFYQDFFAKVEKALFIQQEIL